VIALYKDVGVPKEKVRIKISATWEGIQAARILQRQHDISCLVTVVFGLPQAIAAAEADVDAIAPYVGRIADWGKLHGADGDLGVLTVSQIQNYLRKYNFRTQVMAASFRNTKQVRELAGIDLLTAAPSILEALDSETEPLVAVLTMESGKIASLKHEQRTRHKLIDAFKHEPLISRRNLTSMTRPPSVGPSIRMRVV
jgi:transaldolase